MKSVPLFLLPQIYYLAQGCADVVGIDEAQFFDDEIVKFVMIWQSEFRVIVAGLDMDFKSFWTMPA
jgi:thymidine kinase